MGKKLAELEKERRKKTNEICQILLKLLIVNGANKKGLKVASWFSPDQIDIVYRTFEQPFQREFKIQLTLRTIGVFVNFLWHEKKDEHKKFSTAPRVHMKKIPRSFPIEKLEKKEVLKKLVEFLNGEVLQKNIGKHTKALMVLLYGRDYV